MACISPFLAKLFGIGPLWSFVPLVALGNMAIVLVFSWILGRARRTNGFAKYALWIAAIAAGAAAKFCILYLGIVRIVIPLMTSLPAAKAEKLSAMFSVTQLFTALIGGVIAAALARVFGLGEAVFFGTVALAFAGFLAMRRLWKKQTYRLQET